VHQRRSTKKKQSETDTKRSETEGMRNEIEVAVSATISGGGLESERLLEEKREQRQAA
jgi:hypothetical protein